MYLIGMIPTYTFNENGMPENYTFSHRPGNINIDDHNWYIGEYMELNAVTYITVIEVQIVEGKYANNVILSGIQIERPALLNTGNRITAQFFDSYTNVVINDPLISNKQNKKVNIKIGKIVDTDMLKAIKNKDTGALENLLSYAINAEGIYAGTLDVGNTGSITNLIQLENGEYYFAYMELESEQGKYFKVDDVSLYQALVSENNASLVDYKDGEFVWKLDDDNEIKDDTVFPDGILPQTGHSITGSFLAVLALVIGSIIAVKYKYIVKK